MQKQEKLLKREKDKMKLTEEYRKLNETMQNTNVQEKLKVTGTISLEALTTASRHLRWILMSSKTGLVEFKREYQMLRNGWFESHEKMSESLNETQESK